VIGPAGRRLIVDVRVSRASLTEHTRPVACAVRCMLFLLQCDAAGEQLQATRSPQHLYSNTAREPWQDGFTRKMNNHKQSIMTTRYMMNRKKFLLQSTVKATAQPMKKR